MHKITDTAQSEKMNAAVIQKHIVDPLEYHMELCNELWSPDWPFQPNFS